jgi:hypothetical protein
VLVVVLVLVMVLVLVLVLVLVSVLRLVSLLSSAAPTVPSEDSAPEAFVSLEAVIRRACQIFCVSA